MSEVRTIIRALADNLSGIVSQMRSNWAIRMVCANCNPTNALFMKMEEVVELLHDIIYNI